MKFGLPPQVVERLRPQILAVVASITLISIASAGAAIITKEATVAAAVASPALVLGTLAMRIVEKD